MGQMMRLTLGCIIVLSLFRTPRGGGKDPDEPKSQEEYHVGLGRRPGQRARLPGDRPPPAGYLTARPPRSCEPACTRASNDPRGALISGSRRLVPLSPTVLNLDRSGSQD